MRDDIFSIFDHAFYKCETYWTESLQMSVSKDAYKANSSAIDQLSFFLLININAKGRAYSGFFVPCHLDWNSCFSTVDYVIGTHIYVNVFAFIQKRWESTVHVKVMVLDFHGNMNVHLRIIQSARMMTFFLRTFAAKWCWIKNHWVRESLSFNHILMFN